MKKIIALMSLSTMLAYGSGYEKTVTWSGKYNGRAGAAVSSVADSEGLYFNPAGMAHVEGGNISGNFSPVFSKFTADTGAGTLEGERTFSPFFGVTGAMNVYDGWVVGLGAYAAGGQKFEYENVTEVNFSLIQASLGVAYSFTPEFSFGAAWVASMASFTTENSGSAKVEQDGENYAGARFGFQYITDTFGVGLTGRLPIEIEVEGDNQTLTTDFPLQVALGGHYVFNHEFTAHLEYAFTNYSEVNTKVEAGSVTVADGKNGWNEQHSVRVGFDYAPIENWTFRTGYAFISQVVPENKAQVTSSTAGVAHAVTLGAGTSFDVNGGQKVAVNVAGDYSFSSGSDSQEDAFSDAFGGHLGVSYTF